MSPKKAYFTPALFDFLKALKKNNNRDWFMKNKARYENDVRDPALRFIDDIGPELRKVSPNLQAVAKPVGGSLFRINRDIRFSKDKSPYKTNVGMSFGHTGGVAHGHSRDRAEIAPGLYMHIAPSDSFGGGGIHMPDGRALGQIRDAIVSDTATWKKVTSDAKFKPMFGPGYDTLKRAPLGYDPSHPFVEDLKRKSFTWGRQFTDSEVTGTDLMERYIEACRAATPFNRFMAQAVGVSW